MDRSGSALAKIPGRRLAEYLFPGAPRLPATTQLGGVMKVSIFLGLILIAVPGSAAFTPCFQSPDFISTCPQPESRVLAAPGGTRVTITVVSAEVNATQDYGGVPISYVTRRSNGLTEIDRTLL
jgi:hypothetical protein